MVRARFHVWGMLLVVACGLNELCNGIRDGEESQKPDGRPIPTCPIDQGVCNVVVVVDMQNDYCSNCDEVQRDQVLKQSQAPWSSTSIKDISPSVQKVLEMRTWDMVVLTKDVLKPGTGYLEAGSPGSNVVKEITDHVDAEKVITFTKDTDDWMNTLDGNTSFDGQRHFALEDEGHYVHDVHSHPSLMQILMHNQFWPEKTNLVVTGVLTNRCVLKGAVHARLEGYATFVVKDATGGSTNSDRWEKEANDAPEPYDKIDIRQYDASLYNQLVHSKVQSPAVDLAWRKRIFTGYKGGPSLEDTWTFLDEAKVLVADTAADFQPGTDFDLDRSLMGAFPEELNRRLEFSSWTPLAEQD